MGHIVIYDKDGETIQARATITRAEQSTQLLGEDVIKMEIASTEPIDFQIGDYTEWCGKTYTLNQLPTIKKINAREFTHSLTFEGEQYELMDSAFLLPGDTYGDAFTGDLADFMDIILMNATRGEKDWRLGTIPAETEYKTLSYPQSNCLQVLQNVCREYGYEFEIVRQGAARILNITDRAGGEFLTPFHYGRTGGAYSIERRTATNRNVTTKLFVFGGDRNLPGTYRENKLCLPGKERNESFITDPTAVAVYGKKENVKYFPEIYPARYGNVSATGDKATEFFDDNMDFDLNERNEQGETKWLIPGATAKVQFNSGGLAGYSFEILAYDHQTKKFRLKTYTDPNGLSFPNPNSAAFQIRTGDEYFITDIRVPDSYISDAEQRLQAEGEKWFDENCKPEILYNITLDQFFLKKIYGEDGGTDIEIFRPGMAVTIKDADLQMEQRLRVSAFTRNLLKPYEFTITIADKVQVQTTAARVISELSEIKEILVENNMNDTARARRNWRTTEDILSAVFDPDGYFTDKIRPMSIETRLLAVGARAQQYTLKDCEISANYGADPNAIHNTAGILEHYTIADPDIRTWTIQEGTASGMGPDKTYYIYAKCERDGTKGVILYTPTQIATEGDPQFYHFLVGTTTSVITDSDGKRPARNIALSYGNTTINGRFITTGRMQSADGSTYFDFDKNEIGGRLKFTDGLISEKIWVGQSMEDAKAGIGGFEYDNTNLVWAGRHDKGGGFYFYNFEVIDSGIMRMYNDQEEKVLDFQPNNRLWMKWLYADAILPKSLYIEGENGQYTQIDKDGAAIYMPITTKGPITIARDGNSTGDDLVNMGRTILSNGNIYTTDQYGETLQLAGPPAFIAWLGSIYYSEGTYKKSAQIRGRFRRRNGGTTNIYFDITVSREDEGIVQITFSHDLKTADYFVTTAGKSMDDSPQYSRTPNQAMPNIRNKTNKGFQVTVSDDPTLNDYDFWLQIWIIA